MTSLRHRLLTGIACLIGSALMLPEAQAQAPCIAGVNHNACTIEPGTTVSVNVLTRGNGSTANNAGTVTGSIVTFDDASSVINSGSVGQSIGTAGDNSHVTNSGSVNAYIETLGDGSSVTNSGFVGQGIVMRGRNPTLTLLRGSEVAGAIDLSGPGIRTLNVGPGFSFVQDFINGPTVINAPGAVVATNGNQIAAMETAGLNQASQSLSKLTNGVFGTVHSRLSSAAGASSASGSTTPQFGGGYLMGLGATVHTEPKHEHTSRTEPSSGAWALAFGGQSHDDATSTSAATAHTFAGAVAGVDGWFTPQLRIGFFGGGAGAKLDVAGDSHQVESETVFGGAYANLINGTTFLRLVLTAGRTDYDSHRRLTGPGGLSQNATASFDGSFISPEIAIGTVFDLPWVGIEPSARLSYARLALDGYSETGAPGNFSISDQDIAVWQGRVQVAMPFQVNGVLFAPRIGVEAWSSDRGTISGRLLGQAISFEPGGDDSEVTLFAGASASTSLGAGATAFLDGEVHARDTGIARSEAHAGLRFNF